MNTIITDVIKDTEETFENAIKVINTIKLISKSNSNTQSRNNSKNTDDIGLTVFTDDENNEVWLQKTDNSGSYLRAEFPIVDQDFNFGGFTADMHSRTLRDASGKGYIDSTITIAISKMALNVNTVNIDGIERAIKVLTEGYIRSLEVLYRPSSSEL